MARGPGARAARRAAGRGIRILAARLRSAATAMVRRHGSSIWNRMRLGLGIGIPIYLASSPVQYKTRAWRAGLSPWAGQSWTTTCRRVIGPSIFLENASHALSGGA